MAVKRDYYEVLGVERTATTAEIKTSYRKLAVKFHPDKNPGDHTAEDRFKELGEAYEVLMDDNKRAAYDRFGHNAFGPGAGSGGQPGGGFHDPFDIFREVFSGGGGGIFDSFFSGGGGGGRDPSGHLRGSDLRYDLQITLEEAAEGCEKEVELHKLDACERCDGSGGEDGAKASSCPSCHGRGQVITSRGIFQVAQTCPKCRGSGQVISNPCRSCGGEGRRDKTSRVKLRIPAGIDEGSRLRSTRNGEAGVRGGPPGDLYVVIHIKEHPVFQREEDNLFCELPITFATATLGGELTVPTLSGKAHMKVPAGTQGGTLFRVRGKGMPNLHTKSHGDLLVRVLVEVPTKLNSEQKRKLQEFAESYGEENSPLSKSFLERARDFFR